MSDSKNTSKSAEKRFKMQGSVNFSENGSTLTARIACDVDHHAAKPLREEIDRVMTERMPQVLVLDFSEVGFMDSSGLGLILGRCESAGKIGASVRLEGVSEGMMKLIRLSGVERIKNITVAPASSSDGNRKV